MKYSKAEFQDKSKDIINFTERSGVVEDRSDNDQRSPPIDPIKSDPIPRFSFMLSW